MCGGCRRMDARAALGVSPVRTIARIPELGSPASKSARSMPSSGTSRFLCTSLPSALSGET